MNVGVAHHDRPMIRCHLTLQPVDLIRADRQRRPVPPPQRTQPRIGRRLAGCPLWSGRTVS